MSRAGREPLSLEGGFGMARYTEVRRRVCPYGMEALVLKLQLRLSRGLIKEGLACFRRRYEEAIRSLHSFRG